MTDRTVIDSYDPERFVNWSAWYEVERILRGRGTCCGVGGARGAGKTWLLRRAADWANEGDGIGVYFPSPSAYDPSVFVSGLCQALAVKVEERLRPPRSSAVVVLDVFNRRAVQVGVVAAIVGVVAYYARDRLDSLTRLWPAALLTVGLVILYVAAAASIREQYFRKNPLRRLYLKSLALQRWIQYSSATKSVSELALEAGKGLIAKGKVSEELALSERPVTELALVTEFRELAEQVARVFRSGLADAKVVIAIDELDKIGAIDDVRRLLRSVKGVLDPVGVVLLVSVSDEAVTHLGLGGVRGRDEISSSFTIMLHVLPLSVEQSRKLVAHVAGRAKLDSVADALLAVTGGNQREIVRLLDDSIRRTQPRDMPSPSDCIDAADDNEGRDFLAALVADPRIGEEERVAAFTWLRTYQAGDHSKLASDDIARLFSEWRPSWSYTVPENWPADVAEDWRRYLVRVALRSALRELMCSDIAPGYDEELIETFRSLFELSQTSSVVALQLAREQLACFTRVTSEPPAVKARGAEAIARILRVADAYREQIGIRRIGLRAKAYSRIAPST